MSFCHSRSCKLFLLLLLLVSEVFDLISDWLFYYDVSILEAGLVYGPVEKSQRLALLVFSVIGSVCFLFECSNSIQDFRTGKAFLDLDLVSAVTIWIEDVPQILINVSIAVCREEASSYYQLIKASAAGLLILIQFVCGLVRYSEFVKTCDHHCRRRKTYRIVTILGVVVNLLGVVCVFLLTQTQLHPSGTVTIAEPKTVFEEYYEDARYFRNVSVYFHHPSFEQSGGPTKADARWMRLVSVNDIRTMSEASKLCKYEYQETPTELRMTLWDRSNGVWMASECYSVDKQSGATTPGSGGCASFLAGPTTSLIFQFQFRKPEFIFFFFRRVIFGDIIFNVKINNTAGQCLSVGGMEDTIAEGLRSHNPVVHYYQAKVNENHHLVQEGGRARFFDSDTDLRDIMSVWQTGWMRCSSTGSLAPHLDPSILVPCY